MSADQIAPPAATGTPATLPYWLVRTASQLTVSLMLQALVYVGSASIR